jgi:hypothetical protein
MACMGRVTAPSWMPTHLKLFVAQPCRTVAGVDLDIEIRRVTGTLITIYCVMEGCE